MEPAWHRRGRRARTRARTLVRAVDSGWTYAPGRRVQAARQLLQAHHSAMATTAAWQCQTCRQTVRGTFAYCPGCGQHWSTNPSYSGKPQSSPWPQKRNAAWSQQEPWNWQDNRGLSPRRRPKSPRKRGPAGKAGGKGDPKGAKGPPSATGVGDTTAAPRELPAAPVPAIPPPPREVASSSTTAASEQLLQQIMGALSRSREELPPQLRALLDEHTGEDHKSAGKVMHRLVSAQTTARRELDQVRAARRDFLAQWTKYTTKLCHTWQQQMTEKTRAMQEFDDTEEKWSQQLQGTSRELSKLNGEVQQVDGSDSEDMDAVDTVIEEELQKDDQRRQFQEQMAAREAEITKTLLAACQAAKEQEAYLQERPDRERSPRRRTEQAKPPTRTAAKTKTEPPEQPAGDKLGGGSQQQPPPT